MFHKHLTPIIIMIGLFTIFQSGCGQDSTPDPSIVWADDFEDGDTAGWQDHTMNTGDTYSMNEGFLSFGYGGGDIRRASTVTTGTWSADIFIPEKGGFTNAIFFLASKLEDSGEGYHPEDWVATWVQIENQPYTEIQLAQWVLGEYTLLDSKDIGDRERLTGWHHLDITRDENGKTSVYCDGKKYLEGKVDFPYGSDYFLTSACCEGPALDNVIVRNQVMDIDSSD